VVGPQRARITEGKTAGATRREAKLQVIEPALGSPATAGVEHELSGGEPTAAR
jgi:hypothetical protein